MLKIAWLNRFVMVLFVYFLNLKEMHVSNISWQRTDGLPMPKNVNTNFGRMNIYNAGKADFVEYSCHVLTADNVLIKKNFVLRAKHKMPPKPTAPYFKTTTESSKLAKEELKPKVRIIPIEKDLREGGKVALECESGE